MWLIFLVGNFVVYKYIMLEDDFLDGEVMMSVWCEGESKEEAWKFMDLDVFGTLDGFVLQRVDKGVWGFEVYYICDLD